MEPELGWHAPGPLDSMTDPFYMLMLIGNLGDDYIVWDKTAHIRFRKPGKGKVGAEFRLTDAYLGNVLRCWRMSSSCRGVQPSLHGQGSFATTLARWWPVFCAVTLSAL